MVELSRILSSIKLNATLVGAVYLLALNHPGPTDIVELLFLVKLNVFSIPLILWTPYFGQPTWIWYVIALLWCLQALHYVRVSIRDVVEFIVPTGQSGE